MPHQRYDVIVAGLGAMGSATACHLALRGRRVLGLDRWPPEHTFGSWHGDSRIIRETYFEHPMYVPIVRRAYDLWRELEGRVGRSLLHETGGLTIGPPEGDSVLGALRSARQFGIASELLSGDEVRRRFPAFEPRSGDVAVLDPRAGYLEPEACVAAYRTVARQHGADLRFGEPVLAWEAEGAGVRVTTPCGVHFAERLVLAVGTGVRALVPDLDLPLTVERQILYWLEPDATDPRYDRPWFPIFLHEYAPGAMCYGFPRLPRGVKASVMHGGEVVSDPDAVRRTVGDDEIEPLRRALASILPGLAVAPVRESTVCLFTNTPDHHFLIDFHPASPQVLISSPCSGHGFKFASALGEMQADLITEGRSRFDLSRFSLDRFRTPAPR